jgi:hypothetical protein
MDFITLATGIITALVPYLAKGGEKLAEKIAEEGFEQRSKIWEMAKGLFQEDELTLLNLFEQNPTDERIQGKLEGKLEDKLKANPKIARELDALVKQIPAEIKTNTINITGDNNKTVQDVEGSTITIN